MLTFIFVLGFLIIVLLIIIGGLIKALSIQIKKNDIYTQWIVELQNKVESVYRTMIILDEKQIFVKDDEVGFIFQQLVDLISSLNEKVEK